MSFEVSKESLTPNHRVVIVAGSRGFDDYELFSLQMHQIIREYGWSRQTLVFASGKARTGADALIIRWCEEYRVHWVGFPADWNNIDVPGAIIKYNRYGRPYNALAGMQRNEEMKRAATDLIAFWDGQSSGTRDMIRRATESGLTVITVNL